MSELNELKRLYRESVEKCDEINNSVQTNDDGVMVLSDEHRLAFRKELDRQDGIKAEIELLERQEKNRAWGSETGDKNPGFGPDAGAKDIAPNYSQKTWGEQFTESEVFKQFAASGAGTMPRPVDVKNVYTTMPSGDPNRFGQTIHDPMVTRIPRSLHIEDLLGARQITANAVDFFRVTGFTNAASPVQEWTGSNFGLKPRSAISFEGVTRTVKTIAHWLPAHRNVLADEPQLRGVIDDEMIEGLALQVDVQLLYGDGTGENLHGMLKDPQIQTRTHVSGENQADDVRRAITKAWLSEIPPNAIVIHPNDLTNIELLREGSNSGTYLFAASLQMGGEYRLWKLPIIQTPAINPGKVLVANFGMAVSFYEREQPNIRIAEQHEDFFVRNAIVVLAERRLCLAVRRPEALVLTDLS